MLVTEAALDKLGAKSISFEETEQLLRKDHLTVRDPHTREPGSRRLLIGLTNGGRSLTPVIEQTVELITWPIVTGWASTDPERKLLGG